MYLSPPSLLDTQSIGDAFLSLHEHAGFTRLPPSSLLHDSVPMSFVMSAGLIQVENELENIVLKTGGKFAFTQPCFRHFDMGQVGVDPTRLSLFHMSAAFHIGSSERATVLPRLWLFLTQVLKLDPQCLWISYLDDPELGRDEASYECWKGLGVDEAHLVGMDQEHCFWRQRSTGQIASDGKKCGPHTEVFYEREVEGCPHCANRARALGVCRCGRFVELANSLFIENYIDDTGQLIAADTVFAECVLGLERVEMVLRDLPSVYHIRRFDTWRAMLMPLLPNPSKEAEQSLAVILDHLSAFVKLTEDGAPAPGRGGRAAIMRKLTRSAITETLLLGLDFNLLINQLLKEHSSFELLKIECQRFTLHLEKVKKLIKQYPSNTLTIEQYQALQKNHGISERLIRYFQVRIQNETLVKDTLLGASL
ncbi:alanine--tRNA ligase-related protein [Thiofilum flexile]|uniref:alanine--tRNA ligase-related protein n=1 Tax=Thiofilum flexile TaxID=125627 RepID=UPI0003753C47|nr:alanine--tRNA ligase-related protein [Thiofilum flexile]